MNNSGNLISQNFFGDSGMDALIQDLVDHSSDLTKEVDKLKHKKKKLQDKLKFYNSEIRKDESSKVPENSLMSLKQENLLEFLYKQVTPSSLFSVLRSSEFSTCFLLQSGIVAPNTTCPCGQTFKLNEIFGPLKYLYKCSCGAIQSFFEKTMWKKLIDTPQKLLSYIILWLIGTRITGIQRLLGRENRKLAKIGLLLQSLVSEHYVNTLPKFRGIVEIDESCFKHSTTKPGVSSPEKWVFGLYERERKLVYMECVPARHASNLIPIIQKICEPGTTIISDQWAAYSKLADFGFPHYTVDHSRFFVHPHSREIHTQDIEISWGWAKFEIKRQNRELTNLQEHLHLFCWKRQFKKKGDKKTEIAATLSALCQIIKDAQAENMKKQA